MKVLKWFIVFVMLVETAEEAKSQTRGFSAAEKLETYINVIQKIKKFNGEILIAKGNHILFQKAVGKASYSFNLQLKTGSKYQVASLTKSFTGALIAMAMEEGKLDGKGKAVDYVKELSPKFKDITIAQLLVHRSGLPHNEGIKDYWLTKSKLQMNSSQVIEEINNLDLLFNSGEQMHYSSLGYYLLAIILENIYYKSFEETLKEKILNKLKMTETGVTDHLKMIPQLVTGYHLISDDSIVKAPYRNYSMLTGAGDMYSTTTDLLKWNNCFFSNTILSEKTKAVLFQQQNSAGNNKIVNYNYGWYINTDKPKKLYHGGGTWGYSCFNALYPDTEMSIIILSNFSTLPISEIALDVEKIVFGLAFQMPEPQQEIKNNSKELGWYAGKFISDSNKMELSIIIKENKIFALLTGNPAFEIYPKGGHNFFGKKVEIEFSFEETDNKVTGLKATRMDNIFHFIKKKN